MVIQEAELRTGFTSIEKRPVWLAGQKGLNK